MIGRILLVTAYCIMAAAQPPVASSVSQGERPAGTPPNVAPPSSHSGPLAPVFSPAPEAKKAPYAFDACSSVAGQAAELPKQATGSSSGYYGEESDYYNPQPPPNPKPNNPVKKQCAGLFEIEVGNRRSFAYRLGDKVPITVQIDAPAYAMFDFSSLKKGTIAFDGSDFELAAEPVIIGPSVEGDRAMWRIDLLVQTFVPKYGVPFVLDLRYAVKMSGDGKTPDWNVLSTPEFIVTTSRTLDNGRNIKHGDLSEVAPARAALALPAIGVGLLLVLWYPAVRLAAWLNRTRPGRVPSREEVAWLELDRLFARGSSWYEDERAPGIISATVRGYFDFGSLTTKEIGAAQRDNPQLAQLMELLTGLDKILYGGQKLEGGESAEQIRKLTAQLIARPWFL